MNEPIDTQRLWQTLGQLQEAARQAAEQREHLMQEMRALRAAQDAQRRDHDRLVNRGYGAICAIGAIAGSAGAAVKTLLFSGH
jgi:hypothetical protein